MGGFINEHIINIKGGGYYWKPKKDCVIKNNKKTYLFRGYCGYVCFNNYKVGKAYETYKEIPKDEVSLKFYNYFNSKEYEIIKKNSTGVATGVFGFERWLVENGWEIGSIGFLNAMNPCFNIFGDSYYKKKDKIIIKGVKNICRYDRFYTKNDKFVIIQFGVNNHNFCVSVDNGSTYMSMPITEKDYVKCLNNELNKI
jgi:hypothetical protein